jgi:transposase-like protein
VEFQLTLHQSCQRQIRLWRRVAAMKEALSFPELSASTDQRPARCPGCGRVGMGWHQQRSRPVTDLKVGEVQVVQYQCEGCGASLTVTPPGLQAGCRHSDRTKALSVVLWGLGLSYRDTERVMKGIGLPISHVAVMLNVRAMGAAAMARHKKAASRIKAPVLGADETEVKLSGNGVTVGFLTDPQTGEIVGMEILASREGEELARWIVEAAKHFGAKALVSDELESYKPAAEAAGLQPELPGEAARLPAPGTHPRRAARGHPSPNGGYPARRRPDRRRAVPSLELHNRRPR